MDDSSLTKLRLGTLAAAPDLDPDEADAFFGRSAATLNPEPACGNFPSICRNRSSGV
jgi:hypothetical protein